MQTRMYDEFYQHWEARNNAESTSKQEEHTDKMVSILQKYAMKTYPEIDDEGILIASIKRDFESDLPPVILANALDCSIGTVRRFRYTKDRGVIDRRGGRRQSIPPSVRKEILKRDEDKCVRCGKHDPNLELHHIIPKGHGGVDLPENMAMLCEPCHEDAHCGDFNSGRLAYSDVDEFWDDFCEQ